MTKKQLKAISIEYRNIASQMLKIDSQEEINYIEMYFNFITKTPFLYEYISSCHSQDYDFREIYNNKNWNDMLVLPSDRDELVNYGYQLLQYILDGPKQLFHMGQGYSSSNKFKDIISAFMRKAIEPIVHAIRTYLEISLIDCDEVEMLEQDTRKRIFLSYCHKDSSIADLIEHTIGPKIGEKATISRDIRDVEYHQSFKRFMQTIETHDYVIMIISDNYLKSRNCMFEVLEVIKDSRYKEKLAFIVLEDSDICFYNSSIDSPVGARVYSAEGQTHYSLYWKNIADTLQQQIDNIGNSVWSIQQIKQKSNVEKILLDLPAFMDFLSDTKGLPLSTHIDNEFSDLLKFMNLD